MFMLIVKVYFILTFYKRNDILMHAILVNIKRVNSKENGTKVETVRKQ